MIGIAEIIMEVRPVNETTDYVVYRCSKCGKVLCTATVCNTAEVVHGADGCEHFELIVYGNTSWDLENPKVKERFAFVKYAGTTVYAWRRAS